MWEGVGDRTELQHIDPHSYGHNCVSFLFSWVAQPGDWRPGGHSAGCWFFQPHLISNLSDLQLVWTSTAQSGILRPPSAGCWFSLPHLISNRFNFLCTELYNSSCRRHKSHSFNLSTVKVIFWYSSTGSTCYLDRCISYFDSLAGSEVNIQQWYHCR